MQRRFKIAVPKAKIPKPATLNCMRHSFAAHLLATGTDIRTVQDLMGHANITTTMIYLRGRQWPGADASSPLDID